jgi:hypothetical protein
MCFWSDQLQPDLLAHPAEKENREYRQKEKTGKTGGVDLSLNKKSITIPEQGNAKQNVKKQTRPTFAKKIKRL